jgi:hypothetical protein
MFEQAWRWGESCGVDGVAWGEQGDSHNEFMHAMAATAKNTVYALLAERAAPEPSGKDREATQEFEVRNILTGHCGQRLTPEAVDRICTELTQAMRGGPCAWAFKTARPA